MRTLFWISTVVAVCAAIVLINGWQHGHIHGVVLAITFVGMVATYGRGIADAHR